MNIWFVLALIMTVPTIISLIAVGINAYCKCNSMMHNAFVIATISFIIFIIVLTVCGFRYPEGFQTQCKKLNKNNVVEVDKELVKECIKELLKEMQAKEKYELITRNTKENVK